MIDPNEPLTIERQCELLDVSRSTYYHGIVPRTESAENLAIMLAMDKLYLDYPYFGARRMLVHLPEPYNTLNIKRIRRLMELMGLEAIYQKPKTTIANLQHEKYPYLLRDVKITHPNHVWSTDITYVPMPNGFMYLCAIIDWYSRMILGWTLSNTMHTGFCIEALEMALSKYPKPDIFNSDQGCQFTSFDFTNILKTNQILISMDGKGRALDNIFIERFWRDIKYNCIYLNAFDTAPALYNGIENYIYKHCFMQKHSSLGYKTPASVYFANETINFNKIIC
jgi:putative transposase